MGKQMSVEERLIRSEKDADELRRALDQSSIIVFTDANGVITYVNDKFCEISKYSREELIGKTHRLINSAHHHKEFFSNLWRTISAGKVWKGELKNKAKDGTFYWVFTTIVPFMDSSGKPIQYVAIRTDITELKQIEEQAQDQRVALLHAEKMASLGELAAGTAHELGNPLAAISGRMEFLEMQILSGKSTSEEILRSIGTVKELTERMTRIIRGMRALSRDGTHDPFQKVSVGLLVKDVLSFANEGLQKNNILVDVSEVDDRIEVNCQETQISQILVNLVGNARDAIVGFSEKWIKIQVLDQDSCIVIAVTDSGKGIPQEIAEKILLPFFTTKPAGKGSGLGLSISRTIIEKHNGQIYLDQASPNTRFVITLPK
ncbi:MAG: PAS domain S-box protein [Xanthomonadaceae bacterium]|nr:PAS domain S-box protein [Xanthomonadaceae bacterium]